MHVGDGYIKLVTDITGASRQTISLLQLEIYYTILKVMIIKGTKRDNSNPAT